MLWIISGVSSVGKNTFITSARCAELTGLDASTPTVYPRTIQRTTREIADASNAFVHYNFMRQHPEFRKYRNRHQFDDRPSEAGKFIRRLNLALRRRLGLPLPDPNEGRLLRDRPSQLVTDQLWDAIAGMDVPKKAIVLVARKQELLKRVRSRVHARYLENKQPDDTRYPQSALYHLYRGTDLLRMYQLWCLELERRGIPYILVDSNDESYELIADKSLLESPEFALESPHSRQEIIDVVQQNRFKYHAIVMPYGVRTSGTDHGLTANRVLPLSLDGKSVLDVGCAAGAFCFEAEARGARRVVGVDLRQERLQFANRFKLALHSRVEFIQQDLVDKPLTETFDYVLFLNVIHHLKEPMRFLHYLAGITRECLVVEAPTLTDPKYRKSLGMPFPGFLNRYPLIGVMTQARGDETFVFTESALQRILTEHEKLFARVDIIPSPIKGRVIALCYKAPQSDTVG